MNALSQQYPLASHWTRSSWNGHLFRASLLKPSSSITSRCQSRWLVFFLSQPKRALHWSIIQQVITFPTRTFSFFFPSCWSTVIWFASDRSNSNAIDRSIDRPILFKAISTSMILESDSPSGSISQPTSLTWTLPRKQEVSLWSRARSNVLSLVNQSQERKNTISRFEWRAEMRNECLIRNEFSAPCLHQSLRWRCSRASKEKQMLGWKENLLLVWIPKYMHMSRARRSRLMTFLLSVGINVEGQGNEMQIYAFIFSFSPSHPSSSSKIFEGIFESLETTSEPCAHHLSLAYRSRFGRSSFLNLHCP